MTGDPHDFTLYRGCPQCREREGVLVNLVCNDEGLEGVDWLSGCLDAPTSKGIWRWQHALPVQLESPVSLGEANTPLVPAPATAENLGVKQLYFKNETTNPTWSHKDRLCSVAVTAAKALGARTIVGASSGNHGASMAAYAARAGLGCVIIAQASIAPSMRALIQAYGAELVTVETIAERFVLLAEGVDRHGWFPCSNGTSPPVGSSPFGVAGYKTIAYEIWEQLGNVVPDAVVLPVGYGDTLAGIVRGFNDLMQAGAIQRLPKFISCEVAPRLEQALRPGGQPLGPVPHPETHASSIEGDWTTYQAVQALQSSGGTAVNVTDEELMAAQLIMAATEGLYLEPSSCVVHHGLQKALEKGAVTPDDTVVSVLTSSGLKDADPTLELLPNTFQVDDVASGLPASLKSLRLSNRQASNEFPPEV